MIDVNNLDPENAPAEYALALAEQLEASEETTLGPTDSAFLAAAARVYAEAIDAGRV